MSDTSNLPSVFEYDIDVSSAEAPNPLPEGIYRASVRAVSAFKAGSGAHYARLDYFVTADQYPADFTDGDPEGVIIQGIFSLENNINNWHRLRKTAELHGVAVSRRLSMPDFIGQSVKIKVSHRDFQGQKQANAAAVEAA